MLSDWIDYLPDLTSGVTLALSATAISVLGAAVLGLLVAGMRMSGVFPLRFLAQAYIELFRGTPILVQLFAIYFGLGSVGILIPAWEAGLLTLVLHAGGYLAEAYRSGIGGIGRGQFEAAWALGMTRYVAFRRVVAPQAIRVILPTFGNVTVGTLLATPIIGLIGNKELFFEASRINDTRHDYSVFLLAAAIYLVVGVALAAANSSLERRLQLP